MITQEQLKELALPFALNEHEMRFGHGNKGYVTWLTYLTRPAVTRRIHNVLGESVSDRIIDRWFDDNATSYDQKYNVIVEIQAGGSYHQAIGTDSSYMSAETRAYKRALTHLQVGLYLYELPIIQTKNTGFYDTETRKVLTWEDSYKQAVADALDQLETHLPSDREVIWNNLKTDADILQYYNHEKHLTNAIKLYEGNVVKDGFDIVKHWLIDRKQDKAS